MSSGKIHINDHSSFFSLWSSASRHPHPHPHPSSPFKHLNGGEFIWHIKARFGRGNGIRGGWMDGFVTAWCDAVKSKEFAWDKVPSPKCHLLLLLLLLASSPILDQMSFNKLLLLF
jgi:hypothetical protein